MFPAENTCAGADVSPAFDWTAGPSATQSYALVLTDTFQGLVHWVLWNIPAATRSLPAMLATSATLTTPPGARQMAVRGMGYTGPCPNGNTHTYQFDLHAVDVAMLPVTAGATTTQLKALVTSHSLATASLSAPSNAK
jgi:Raf kinase inhibitor-like YbhB/YbcL family protein